MTRCTHIQQPISNKGKCANRKRIERMRLMPSNFAPLQSRLCIYRPVFCPTQMAASGIQVCGPVLGRKWQVEYGFASANPTEAQIVLLPGTAIPSTVRIASITDGAEGDLTVARTSHRLPCARLTSPAIQTKPLFC